MIDRRVDPSTSPTSPPPASSSQQSARSGPSRKTSIALLAEAIDEVSEGRRIVELGAGDGRLAGHLDPSRYHGFDARFEAVALARAQNPRHLFEVFLDPSDLPEAPLYLLFDYLRQLDDDTLRSVLERLGEVAEAALVAEPMRGIGETQHARNERSAEELGKFFADVGYDERRRVRPSDQQGEPLPVTMIEFTRRSS